MNFEDFQERPETSLDSENVILASPHFPLLLLIYDANLF